MTAHCNDSVPAPYVDTHAYGPDGIRARRDIPKSGSRREAIEVLTRAAGMAQACHSTDCNQNKIQAALNYMIMHDGW